MGAKTGRAISGAQPLQGLKLRQHVWRHTGERLLIYFLLVLVALLALLPLMWAFAASFTPNAKVFEHAFPFSLRALFPVEFTLEAYGAIFARGFGDALKNSFWLAGVTVVLGGTINALAGFAFARFEFRGKRFLFLTVILLPFLVPVDLTAIPRFILVNTLDWRNTWQALIVPGLGNSLAIFLFRQFFEEIPQDLIDAARVDGASWLQLFFNVVLPLSRPVLITAALFLFLQQWDAYFWPLLVAPRPELRLVQVAISTAVEEHRTRWNEQLAGSMLAAIVPILLLLPFQRYYIQAVTSSGLKD
ncbi:MAG: carbohydrate ABC transporter permease [Anaerolineaceae bacterium]|nr:carbohydrate ABC transporter permease [Anaerolineaceae bacterium]MDE0329024.1 carbohydrate ABC transporter permease [Anaerolineaceae bacterium]